jgi:hypothetical protein
MSKEILCNSCLHDDGVISCSQGVTSYPNATLCAWYDDYKGTVLKNVIPILSVPTKEDPIESIIYNDDTKPKAIFYSCLP